MKKGLLGLITLCIVAAVAIGSTIAFTACDEDHATGTTITDPALTLADEHVLVIAIDSMTVGITFQITAEQYNDVRAIAANGDGYVSYKIKAVEPSVPVKDPDDDVKDPVDGDGGSTGEDE
jgi:hypothetical protein